VVQGAFNLSLSCARMRPLLQIKLPREPPACDYHAGRAAVICPRGTRIYVRHCLVKNGRGEPDARRPRYRIYGRCPFTTRCDRE